MATPAFVSFDTLSRGVDPRDDAPLVIVDEAHHARTPTTRRHQALARQGQRRPLLLLTATPVHNARRDLAHLLALVMGQRAHRASLPELQALVVRRTDASIAAPPPRPTVRAEPPLTLPAGDDLLEALLTVGPPVPPRDGGHADALVTLGLVRAWASSDAALVATLRRRLAMARALDDSLADGRYPSRAELEAWTLVEGAQQLALPLLVSAPADNHDLATLRDHVQRHADLLREVLARLNAAPSARDAARAAHLRALVDGARDERVLAFTHSADTARALYARLRDLPGLCVLTADGAEVAGGRLARDEALARFAPQARGARPPAARDAIRLLIATDLLAEGLNLQDATVVVHLDLPWTPARLEQRVGRVVRPGSDARTVRVLTVAPPARSEAVVRVVARLQAKLADASASVGIVAVPGAALPPASDIEARERIRAVLERWRRAAAVEAPTIDRVDRDEVRLLADRDATWIACVHDHLDGPHARLITDVNGDASDDLHAVLAALEQIAPCDRLRTHHPRAMPLVAAWRTHHAAAARAGLAREATAPSRLQRRALVRATTAVTEAAPHQRAARADLAARARGALTRPSSARRDATLDALQATHPTDDDRWLAAIAALDADPEVVP
jgi:hypothetical protein